MTDSTRLTCPRCGSALGGTTSVCPSCLTPLADGWDRFVAAAAYLAGGAMMDWIHRR
jgi:predicted amidophosphoribosyltransferase